MKQRLLVAYLLLTASSFLCAQKQNFDIVKYTAIKNAKQEVADSYISFTVTDNAKGSYCRIAIYKSTRGSNSSKANFDNEWQQLVQKSLGAGNAEMQPVSTDNGWEFQSGTASFNKNGASGAVMLITATGENRVLSFLAIFNADTYAQLINDFIASVELQKPTAFESHIPVQSQNTNGGSIAGIWADYVPQTIYTGLGTVQQTAGYTNKEYRFFGNGKYVFLHKMWLTTLKDIVFVYETGAWITQGNKLILTPETGKTEEWSKVAGKTKEWGKKLKSADKKREKTIYTFTIETDLSFSNSTSLQLYEDTVTAAEIKAGNKPHASYTLKEQSLIDLPPGFNVTKTTEAKSGNSNISSKAN